MSSESLAYLTDAHNPVQLLDEERDKASHFIQVHATHNRQFTEQGPPAFLGEGLLNSLPHFRTAKHSLDPLHRLVRHLLGVAADAGQHEDACLELVLHSDQPTATISQRATARPAITWGQDKAGRYGENSDKKTERRIS